MLQQFVLICQSAQSWQNIGKSARDTIFCKRLLILTITLIIFVFCLKSLKCTDGLDLYDYFETYRVPIRD